MKRKRYSVERAFFVFFDCSIYYFRFDFFIESAVYLSVRHSARKDSRYDLKSGFEQRFYYAGSSVVRFQLFKNFRSANDRKIFFTGNYRVERIGFMMH